MKSMKGKTTLSVGEQLKIDVTDNEVAEAKK